MLKEPWPIESNKLKTCFKCKKSWLATTASFYKNKVTNDGLERYCKDCCRLTVKVNTKRRKENPNSPRYKEYACYKPTPEESGLVKAGLSGLFYIYKKQATVRNLVWELSLTDFEKLTSSNCFYTGRPPSQLSKSGRLTSYTYNGIDRLDSSKGYTLDNVVPCCWPVNRAKASQSFDAFITLCYEVVNHSERKLTKIIKTQAFQVDKLNSIFI